MNFFERRKYKKYVKQYLHEAQHALNMREDITEESLVNELRDARAAVLDAWKKKDAQDLDAALDKLSDTVTEIYPPRTLGRFRENYEIILVALAVAMAFRTYFIQPFKIPTGSMQPTLYGIVVTPKPGPTASDRFPLNILKLACYGKKFVSVAAQVSGRIDNYTQQTAGAMTIFVDGVPHEIPIGMYLHFRLGQTVAVGQTLATGERQFGDHIFVDKVRYNFSRPKRGDIIVFDTSHIDHPDIRTDTFYIKRCAGLPGETIQIDPPYLVADGERIEEPYPFKRLLVDDGNYPGIGYTLAHFKTSRDPLLMEHGDELKLADDEYLPLGDNTLHSLDGRYFGAVNEKDLVGPAFAVYWPFGPRWGHVE